jgi:hypothetical protein
VEHETAASLLTDYALGRLSAERRPDLELHLASCPECRGVVATIGAARAELAAGAGPLFEPHPTAEELAGLAVDPEGLDPDQRARIGAHASVCPTCAREVELARAAERTAWIRSAPAWARVAGRGAPATWPTPALAVLAALLAFPAFLGTIRYPETRATNQRLERDLRALEARLAPTPPTPALERWGGPAPLLSLSGPERGIDAVASVRPRPGQPYLAMLIAYEPAAGPADSIDVRIVSAAGAVAWSARATEGELWDRHLEALSLLVPGDALRPGHYRLELRVREGRDPRFTAPFRVLEPVAAIHP